ncbi:MAG: site-specific integrase [Dehalococcoidales bacterium]|nr:site-specific integrase [Dehalococcoidales bacterium]
MGVCAYSSFEAMSDRGLNNEKTNGDVTMAESRVKKMLDAFDGLILHVDSAGPMYDALHDLKIAITDDKHPPKDLPASNHGANMDRRSNAFKTLTPDISPSRIPTRDVIASLLKQKKHKRVKESSLETYEKRFNLFAQKFPLLPEKIDPVMEYLARFDGESGRHRRNNQDLLNMLYNHAVRFFNLPDNPIAGLERPQITGKLIKTLSWNQVRLLNRMPEILDERAALDLLLGHGWRQIEVRRILAVDVAEITDDIILCHGKEREETAPILPQTAERLRKMAEGLKPGDHLFVSQLARQGKKQPLGEDGMSQLVERLFRRAGIEGFTGHDLRRTFATLVTVASKDEFLAMRLIRDVVPGLSNRYIKYPMSQLTDGLSKYSPVSVDGESESSSASRGYV